ncbi:LPS export ABC transporter permease LptF [Desulforegula conservatrix]|uniref:LPS export ABC transporter permease LptF n=1 Tax=Desulforegula conservatrix TaxID=153026 RepID=UPI00041FC968|nr:LPS export ABC transporter permease LptF [Desulforegula conservatrix]
MRILDKYIFRELFFPFALNLLFFTFVFLMSQVLDIAELIVNYRTSLTDIFYLLLYSSPFFLQFTIPLSVMAAVLLSFMRLSGDNEIIAIRSGGVSPYRLIPPVIAFSLFAAVLTGIMTFYGLPWGKQSFRNMKEQLITMAANLELKPRVFNDRFDNIMLYVNEIDKETGRMKDVFIEDSRSPDAGVIAIIAPEGYFISDPAKGLHTLRLYRGNMLSSNMVKKTANSGSFTVYDIHLRNGQKDTKQKDKWKSVEEMYFTDMLGVLKDHTKKDKLYYKIVMKMNEKFTMPFASVVLALLALPLGLSGMSRKKSRGITQGIIFFAIYYVLLTAGWSFGESGAYHPALGMWVPNIVTLCCGIYFMRRVAKEKPVALEAPFMEAYAFLKSKFSRLGSEA